MSPPVSAGRPASSRQCRSSPGQARRLARSRRPLASEIRPRHPSNTRCQRSSCDRNWARGRSFAAARATFRRPGRCRDPRESGQPESGGDPLDVFRAPEGVDVQQPPQRFASLRRTPKGNPLFEVGEEPLQEHCRTVTVTRQGECHGQQRRAIERRVRHAEPERNGSFVAAQHKERERGGGDVPVRGCRVGWCGLGGELQPGCAVAQQPPPRGRVGRSRLMGFSAIARSTCPPLLRSGGVQRDAAKDNLDHRVRGVQVGGSAGEVVRKTLLLVPLDPGLAVRLVEVGQRQPRICAREIRV